MGFLFAHYRVCNSRCTWRSFKIPRKTPKARWAVIRWFAQVGGQPRREMRNLRIYAFLSLRAVGKNHWIFISVRVSRWVEFYAISSDEQRGSSDKQYRSLRFSPFLLYRLLASRFFPEVTKKIFRENNDRLNTYWPLFFFFRASFTYFILVAARRIWFRRRQNNLGELLKFEADKYRATPWFMIAKFASENCGCPDKT